MERSTAPDPGGHHAGPTVPASPFGASFFDPGAGRAARRPSVHPYGMRIQESPRAGSQHHQAEALWSRLHSGAPPRLVREPANHHDARTVAVYWRDAKPAHVPRAENETVADPLDSGRRLEGRIVRLKNDPSPWERVWYTANVPT